MSGPVGSAATIARLNAFASTKRGVKCPNCRDRGVVVYDTHSGDQICKECGQVLESKVMSEEQEWRSFSNTDGGGGTDRRRVGGPNDTWLESGVQGTSMMGGDRRFNRLAQAHELATAATSGDRALKTSFNNLRLIGDFFALKENVLERCKEMVKDLQTSGELKSRTGITYMLAVVYLAEREEKQPTSFTDLVKYDRTIREKDLGKAANRIKKLLPQRSAAPATYASCELVPRYCASLSLGPTVASLGQTITENAERNSRVTGAKPNTLAGAAIYIAVQLSNVREITPMDITHVARTGFQSLMTMYAQLLPHVRSLVPPGFVPLNSGGINALQPPTNLTQ